MRVDASTERRRGARWNIRTYGEQGDWLRVMRALAPLLAQAYPNGEHWLARRLDDVEDELAFAHVLIAKDHLKGIAIESPKGPGRVKLSTLWVHPEARAQGLGRELLGRCTSRWMSANIQQAWITANMDAVSSIERLIRPSGFRLTCCERDRYGIGRHEWVFHWSPDCLGVQGRPVPQHAQPYAAGEQHVRCLGQLPSQLVW